MEDLDGLIERGKNGDDYILKYWPIYKLHKMIEYKAEEKGIGLKYVDPRYTSRRCFKCGHISKQNRKNGGESFKCVECGHNENADYNAAKNLAIPGIDLIIQDMICDIYRADARDKKHRKRSKKD